MTADCPAGSTAPSQSTSFARCGWREQGYRIWTQAIPAGITPKNRLLIGAPLAGSA